MGISGNLRRRARLATLVALAGGAAAAFAQAGASAQTAPATAGSRPLNLPENPELFGTTMPSVIKATAIVNGEVITQSDIDQRLALFAISNGTPIPPDQIAELRRQVLRDLIDETLEIQAAKADKINVSDRDIDRALERLAQQNKKSTDELAQYLAANGSSVKTLRRQIQGQIAWSRLQQRRIEDTVSVGDDEVKAVIDRLNAAKGTEEYRIGEIYIAAPNGDVSQAMAKANQLLEQLQKGGSFPAYARQYSQASTAAVGGDLGWVRPDQLPGPLAAAVRTLQPGQVSVPIPVAGGVSIIGVQDARKVLGADPRNAVLSLKQVSIKFPQNITRAQAEPLLARFARAASNIGGCGGADKVASEFNGEVVSSSDIKLRELPPAVQQMLLPLQVGQATQPFGSIDEGARVLVLCGRDQIAPTPPTYDQVYAQLNEQRMNMKAQRYLRDLRSDAVIEYR